MKPLALTLALLSGIEAHSQADSCLNAAPLAYFDCDSLPTPYPQTVTRCYQFITAGSGMQFSFGHTAFCSVSTTYTLHNCLCDTIATNTTGYFDVAPGVCFVMCATAECVTGGWIERVCIGEWLALPIELVSFTGTPEIEGIVIRWVTASERDSFRFLIVRDEVVIGFADAARISTDVRGYEWTDVSPLRGGHIYRLDLVNLDGTRTVEGYALVRWEGREGSLGRFDLLGRRVR